MIDAAREPQLQFRSTGELAVLVAVTISNGGEVVGAARSLDLTLVPRNSANTTRPLFRASATLQAPTSFSGQGPQMLGENPFGSVVVQAGGSWSNLTAFVLRLDVATRRTLAEAEANGRVNDDWALFRVEARKQIDQIPPGAYCVTFMAEQRGGTVSRQTYGTDISSDVGTALKDAADQFPNPPTAPPAVFFLYDDPACRAQLLGE